MATHVLGLSSVSEWSNQLATLTITFIFRWLNVIDMGILGFRCLWLMSNSCFSYNIWFKI